jgi:hypothetical protein
LCRFVKQQLEGCGTGTRARHRGLTGSIVDINLKGETACGLIDRLNDRGVRVVIISG